MAIIIGFLLMFVFVDVGLTGGEHMNDGFNMMCESMDGERNDTGDCDIAR